MKNRYNAYSDEQLISRLIEDDSRAFSEIYSRYAEKLYIHVRNKTQDREASKDLVQELFASLWQNRAALRADISLSGYLFAAIKYQTINWIARRKHNDKYIHTLLTHSFMDNQSADTRILETEVKQQIEEEISQLPKKMQAIFRMSREQHLSHREIAQTLSLSESTVKKQVNNALKTLRLKFGAYLLMLVILAA
ncbi:RNA polymerase sigma factor [Parapedobacter tibetensis]|uniref:RNA polymerase sigma factor n=1 Tax=Parapedobacter tibetensis TaxID=2972951 RepID=UPI00214DACE2|nr:sigma-70 family RNA polymerase sigma factor [Parapedobacter tibetensis]